MKILVVGSGAREHTIVWKMAQSRKTDEIYAAPGNAGTARIARNLDVKLDDIAGMLKAAQLNNIDLTIVGPEAPLAEGIVDLFQAEGMKIVGSTKAATEIESSKVFSKGLMQKYGIPCGQSESFNDYAKAQDYVRQKNCPLVIKADGLAAGKGVIMAETTETALQALADIMEKKVFGAAGDRVIVEEWLIGKEISVFCFTDGTTIVPMVSACDYKKAYDSDKGLNTGGMGSYSPPAFITPELTARAQGMFMEPTINAMRREGRPYKGVLFGGLILTESGPKALEFNARLGDPECQVILPRLKTDLVDIMTAIADGTLGDIEAEWSEDPCVGVVMASGGYPGSYKTGYPISGIDDVDSDVTVFHAGTKVGATPGEVLTNGGRVLTVVATGKTRDEARQKAYDNVSRIHFEGCHYRKDIALIK